MKKAPSQVGSFVRNLLVDRTAWIRRLLDPRRDIDAECGHPVDVQSDDYKKSFLRGDIAARVVSVWPEESWSENPAVFETEDEQETEFEVAWHDLQRKLSLFTMMQRADVLSGIGRFGVILLGLGDGKTLNVPVEGASKKNELLYTRVFDEVVVKVKTYENDVTNPRYGLPVMYEIEFSNNMEDGPTAASGEVPSSSKQVHWSRIIHLADNRTSSEVFGHPRMEKVFNRLLDIKKIAGGSGEMFWKGGFPGVSLETHPSEVPVELDMEATKAQIEAYQNGLQRYLALNGMMAKSLSAQVADPNPHIEIQIRLVAMTLGVPWRIFLGSEQAQLASEQDTKAWLRRLTRRREEYVTPFIILPLVERLIAFGVLPEPEQILVAWPDLTTLSDKDKAEVAEKRTNALAKYVQGGCDLLVPPFHYLTIFQQIDEKEARSIIEEAGEQLEETDIATRKGNPLEPAPTNGNGHPAPARNVAPPKPAPEPVPPIHLNLELTRPVVTSKKKTVTLEKKDGVYHGTVEEE